MRFVVWGFDVYGHGRALAGRLSYRPVERSEAAAVAVVMKSALCSPMPGLFSFFCCSGVVVLVGCFFLLQRALNAWAGFQIAPQGKRPASNVHNHDLVEL